MLENLKPFLPVIIILVIIVLVIGIITKLIKAAIMIAVAMVVIPTLFTVFFADGSHIVSKTAEYLPDDRAQLLEEGYQYFKDKEAQNPALDVEKIQEDAGKAVDRVQDTITDVGKELIDKMENFDPNSLGLPPDGDFKLDGGETAEEETLETEEQEDTSQATEDLELKE